VPEGGLSRTVVPELRETGGEGHFSACHLTQEQRTRIWTEEIAPKL
jgi:peptide/nickel transport system ATP-binding protein